MNLVFEVAAVFPEIAFVINGDGAARNKLQEECAKFANVYFGDYQPIERLSEVLATGDIHLVPLRTGLASVSVPSKSYSILAAGRPMLAAIDPNTEIPNMLRQSGAGVAVEPDNSAAFIAALRQLVSDRSGLIEMGKSGRRWVETHASPASVAAQYEAIFLANR